jgi:hypothetical protein
MSDVPRRTPAPPVGAGPGRLGHRDRIDFVEDSRMQNVVSLQPDRPRPQRALGVPRSGARILFFTGVRYCRDDATVQARPDAYGAHGGNGSERMLDAAAH